MIDRGKQFEFAVMKSAYSRIRNPTLTKQSMLAFFNGKPIEAAIQNAADRMVDSIGGSRNTIRGNDVFYDSFILMGGQRPEPKTDIIFRKNGVKHRCSLKYGGRFQLSSAGIESSVKVLNDVLTKVSFSGGLGGLQVKKVASVLTELSEVFDGPKRQEKPIMDRLMREAKKEGGINETLQDILGSRKMPEGSKVFQSFKEELVREALTGRIAFGVNNDKTANFILTDKYLRRIDATLVREVTSKTYVDIRPKGRGLTKEGIKLNEAVVRIESID